MKPKKRKPLCWAVAFVQSDEESAKTEQVFVMDQKSWTKLIDELKAKYQWNSFRKYTGEVLGAKRKGKK